MLSGEETPPEFNWLVAVNKEARFAPAPFVERYCTSILLPAEGAIPNVCPSPKDSSKKPLGASFRI